MIVWIFREHRSGSTAFAESVAKHLNRTHLFVSLHQRDEVLAISNPQDYVFSTHVFNFLEIMKSYSDEIVLIRCTRKNKVEQWISYLLGWWMNRNVPQNKRFWNMKRDDTLNVNLTTFEQLQPALIIKKEVQECSQYFFSMKEYWDRISKDYLNFTVYYEDLCDSGIDIPPIELYGHTITSRDSYTIKLPEYKHKQCINYDMVEKWINEYTAQVVEW